MSPVPSTSPRRAIPVREFARLDGCSPKRVRNGRERGALQCDVGGQPYADQVGGEWRLANRRAGRPAQLTVNVPVRAAMLTSGADPGASEAANLAGAAWEAAFASAELLLPHLPEDAVRAIVAEVHRRTVKAGRELLEWDWPPPPGYDMWADHPAFQGEGLVESDWRELLADHAAGRLAYLG